MVAQLFDTPWVTPAIAAIVAASLALLAHYLGGIVLRRVTRSMPVLSTLLGRIRRPARYLLPLLALQLVWQASPDDQHFITRTET